MSVSDRDIQFIKADLLRKGITIDSLRVDLLDHLLCGIEEHRKNGLDFQESYEIAWHELNGDFPDGSIQKQTISVLRETKNIIRNLLILAGTLISLIFVFISIKDQPNPALILVCLSTGIFIVYHCIFYLGRNKDRRSKIILFTSITGLPIIIVLWMSAMAAIPNTVPMILWYVLIFAVAIPIYYRVVLGIARGNSTALSFIKQATEFIAIASFLWIGVAGSLVFIRPEVDIRFLPDLFVQGSCFLLLSWLIRWASTRKEILRVIFQAYVRR